MNDLEFLENFIMTIAGMSVEFISINSCSFRCTSYLEWSCPTACSHDIIQAVSRFGYVVGSDITCSKISGFA